MPNDGRNIYAIDDKGIDLIKDVYAVLNLSPLGYSYDLGYAYFNEHGQINMDSLIKPIYSDKSPYVNTEDFDKYNYGYIIPVKNLTTASELIYAAQNEVWEFQPPIKGVTYANLAHFNGYDHEAAFNGWGKPYIEIYNDVSVAYIKCSHGSKFSTSVVPERMSRFKGWHYAFLLCKVVGENIWQPYYASCVGSDFDVEDGSSSLPEFVSVGIEPGVSYVVIQFMSQTTFSLTKVEGLSRMPWADGLIMIPNFKEKGYCISNIVTSEDVDRTPRYTAIVTASVDTKLHKLDYELSLQNINAYAPSVHTGTIRLKWYLTTDPYSVVASETYRKRYITETIFDSVLVHGENPIFAGEGSITFHPASNEIYVECEYTDSSIKEIDKPLLRWRIT